MNQQSIMCVTRQEELERMVGSQNFEAIKRQVEDGSQGKICGQQDVTVKV